MNKLNKESKVYVVQYYGKALVIHYDNNIHCYTDRKGVQVITGDLHALLPLSLKIDKRRIETIIIDPLFVSYKLESCLNLFSGFVSLERIVGLEYLNTSEVMNMECMFFDCRNLKNLDLRGLDTSKVKNMQHMFYGCKNLTDIDVSNFNTSSVKYMDNMFGFCKSLISLNLRNFDTSEIVDMHSMFHCCEKLKAINTGYKWDLSNVRNSESMFAGCLGLLHNRQWKR